MLVKRFLGTTLTTFPIVMKPDLSRLVNETQRALAQYGAAEILGNLADVPSYDSPNAHEEARRFVELYGPLIPIDFDHNLGMFQPLTDERAAENVIRAAGFVRSAWDAKTPAKIQQVNVILNYIFEGLHRPGGAVMQADFATGKFQPIPGTLLEILLLELMNSRRRLKRCERPECQRHFVKQHARHRYCSAFCSEEMRVRYLKDWASKHSEEIKAQRAKRRSHAKRHGRKN